MPATRLPIIGSTTATSPLQVVLHAAFEAAGREVQLEPIERRPHQVADTLREVRDDPAYIGALLVAPHKEKAAALVASLSDDAKVSGAVNVVVTTDGRLRGHNTDVDGVRAGLVALLPRVRGKWPREAVVLGAGGGARAVVSVLISSGFQHVAVFNRHLHRAETLAAHFAKVARHVEVRARPWHDAVIESEIARAELVVNASGGGSDAVIPDELMAEGRYVLDLVLGSGETSLMASARQRGGTVANGHESFIAGCAATFRLLTGADAPADVLRTALTADGGGGEDRAVVGD